MSIDNSIDSRKSSRMRERKNKDKNITSGIPREDIEPNYPVHIYRKESQIIFTKGDDDSNYQIHDSNKKKQYFPDLSEKNEDNNDKSHPPLPYSRPMVPVYMMDITSISNIKQLSPKDLKEIKRTTFYQKSFELTRTSL